MHQSETTLNMWFNTSLFVLLGAATREKKKKSVQYLAQLFQVVKHIEFLGLYIQW